MLRQLVCTVTAGRGLFFKLSHEFALQERPYYISQQHIILQQKVSNKDDRALFIGNENVLLIFFMFR